MGLLFVTDLDGTLLDHGDYSYAAATPALAALRGAGIPLVLATSKTAEEVRPLHLALELGATPAIVENGAGLFHPDDDTLPEASDYQHILDALNRVPADLRHLFEGFAEMGESRVAQLTGLPLASARRARRRAHSEPGLWTGSTDALSLFQHHLAALGLSARHGGRFLTVSRGLTKADAMTKVARSLNATSVVALGDAPNDVELLQRADIGVIIANPHGTPIPTLPGEAGGSIRRCDQPGPTGWNASVLGILEELGAI